MSTQPEWSLWMTRRLIDKIRLMFSLFQVRVASVQISSPAAISLPVTIGAWPRPEEQVRMAANSNFITLSRNFEREI